ncbi:MAG: hypothetical protein ABSG25_01600 [Bryobacteraceae bacterium]
MKLKTGELFTIFSILDSYTALSKAFTSEYKEYVRLYSKGDGKLYFIANNCEDLKIIQTTTIDIDTKIDKLYTVSELSNIVKNVMNYVEVELIDDIIYFEDGKFTLFVIDSMNEDKKEELFNIQKYEVDKKFNVDSDLEEELKDIFLLLNLKSQGASNSYFYKDGRLYFNFNELYIRKDSILNFIITDIISLRMISKILLKNKGSLVNYGTVNSKLVLDSNDFYIESSVFVEDENSVNYLTSYFDKIVDEKQIKMKLEFVNFVSAINTFDSESTVTFKDDEVFISSKFRKNVANFKIENIESEFIISTDILYKVLSYIIKFKNVNSLDFKLISINDNKFLEFNYGTIKIITEVV